MSLNDLSSLLAHWPVEQAAIGVTNQEQTLGLGGDAAWTNGVASISKTVAAYAGLVALEEGTITLDHPAGSPGSTVRHLLSHASGVGFDDDQVLAQPGTRRIYSNTGIEQFAAVVEAQAEMPFATYQQEAVLGPLGMTGTQLVGSPAHGLHTNVTDLLAFGRELLKPTLVSPATLTMATTAQFPALAGILPGIGRMDPNPWGLGFELKAKKSPHWTSPFNSSNTFGHFGGSGSFLWVDPVAGLACCAITNLDFGPWALEVWPPASTRVLEMGNRAAS